MSTADGKVVKKFTVITRNDQKVSRQMFTLKQTDAFSYLLKRNYESNWKKLSKISFTIIIVLISANL